MRKRLLDTLFEKISRIKTFQEQIQSDQEEQKETSEKRAIVRLKPRDKMTKDYVRQFSQSTHIQITTEIDKKLLTIRDFLIKKWQIESRKNDFILVFKQVDSEGVERVLKENAKIEDVIKGKKLSKLQGKVIDTETILELHYQIIDRQHAD